MVSTDEMVALALRMSGLDALPADSEVIVPGQGITRLAVGIELGLAELMLARQLGYDGALTHHPQGRRSFLGLCEALLRHEELMRRFGVPSATAGRLAGELSRREALVRHAKDFDAAAAGAHLVGLPLVGLHTPLDEIGRARMQACVDDLLRRRPSATVGDVVEALGAFGEFRNAMTRIEVRSGSASAPAGRVAVCHGAGCNGGFAIAKAYFDAGVGTLLYIHVSPGELAKIRAETRGNLIVTGHIASDSLGINPFLDALRKRGVECTNFGGIVAGG